MLIEIAFDRKSMVVDKRPIDKLRSACIVPLASVEVDDFVEECIGLLGKERKSRNCLLAR